ncbi:T9SS type A sorting domain-containing protein [Mangrovimonas sp. YM274]|uniref:T9SS type A sorting domain-containing protein n=1 Tax=Mangrovimonas sp. YM274 TaxID=3070660 RepID=UPI0027DBAA29|nr:T9SS type A sorting domain-containing protein [Mangrovimonas sp. YM274]WMI69695.1 T9SS type A sorting domain-containing protein [Mangrovimonas sp. YM274]
MRLQEIVKIIVIVFGIMKGFGQTGCTDPLANNYDAQAVQNDGSCTYDTSIVSPESSIVLDSSLEEASGLMYWMNSLWTHNDSADNNLYEINPSSGALLSSIALASVENIDWEDIAQDENYVYLGDFGNNVNGNRTDLKIIRISKTSLEAGNPNMDFINFSFSDQIDFTPQGVNNTDFDCEAMIVFEEDIFLFTKEWISNGTKVYKLPKKPGTFVAQMEGSYDVQGLITGAEAYEDTGVVVLLGYNDLVMPFLFLLYDFNGDDFFGGNKRRLELNLLLHQAEGIATSNGLDYYIVNEEVSILGVAPQLHAIDLSTFLEGNALGLEDLNQSGNLGIVPNPGISKVEILGIKKNYPITFQIMNMMGQVLHKGLLQYQQPFIDISKLSVGLYMVMFYSTNNQSQLLVKE